MRSPHTMSPFLTQCFLWKLGVEFTWHQYEKQGEPPLIKLRLTLLVEVNEGG